ncbi:MAG TPA: hypothetical protein VGN32_07265, partial [Ktedonobacterales bacterium]|nr:hypothetical protein [Ktedonobacterales bacterium]
MLRKFRAQLRRGRLRWWTGASLLIVGVMVLSSCGSSTDQALAQHNKSQLDGEIQHARQIGIPDSMLKPIEAQETKVAAGQGGWTYNYHDAASNYALLYSQLLGTEQQSVQVLQQAATANVAAFSAALDERKAQGFIEVSAYQTRLTQAQQDLASAKTANDFAKVSDESMAQAQALRTMWPAYQQLSNFRTMLKTLQQVGVDTSSAQAEYQQDLMVFRDAATADRYTRLQGVILGQTVQLVADQAQAMPYIGAALLQTFQSQISLLKTFGEDTGAFQQQHDGDARDLLAAKSLADYLTVARNINGQSGAMALPLARGQAHFDLMTLESLIASTQATNPLIAYEYNSPAVGVGDAVQWYNEAPLGDTYNWTCGWDVICRYGIADQESVQMYTNLRAELDNLNDPTVPWLPHKTDFELMQQYGILQGQVTIVSLREQTLRAYQNGKMVWWTYVTTGRFERASPPGVQYTQYKQAPIEFLPTEPVGSPIRGFPTHINYGVNYNSPL